MGKKVYNKRIARVRRKRERRRLPEVSKESIKERIKKMMKAKKNKK